MTACARVDRLVTEDLARQRTGERLEQPDIPEGSDIGFFFNQYIRQKYVALDRFGWIVYDSAQSEEEDRVEDMSAEALPFAIERSGAGVVLLKGVAKSYVVQVYLYGVDAPNLPAKEMHTRVLEDGDVQVRIVSGTTNTDAKVFVRYVRMR